MLNSLASDNDKIIKDERRRDESVNISSPLWKWALPQRWFPRYLYKISFKIVFAHLTKVHDFASKNIKWTPQFRIIKVIQKFP